MGYNDDDDDDDDDESSSQTRLRVSSSTMRFSRMRSRIDATSGPASALVVSAMEVSASDADDNGGLSARIAVE